MSLQWCGAFRVRFRVKSTDWGRTFGLGGGELSTEPTYWTCVYKPTVLLSRSNTQLTAEHMSLPCHWCGAFRVRFRIKSADWGRTFGIRGGSELGIWLIDRWPLRGLHWQHMTSHRKPSTPARDCLLGSTLDRPHTMAGTCVRRPIEYSTERAWPLARR